MFWVLWLVGGASLKFWGVARVRVAVLRVGVSAGGLGCVALILGVGSK